MKLVGIVMGLLMALPAWAADSDYVIDCVVSRVVDDNVFEEGLSVDEYPDVYVKNVIESDDMDENGLSVRVGSMQAYRDQQGDTVSVSRTGGRVTVRARYQGENDEVKITRTNVRRGRGYIGYLDYNGSLVAYLKCK